MRVLLIWLNLKLKREKEITDESMFMNQDVLVLLPSAYEKNSVDITNVDYKWATKQHEGVCLFTSIIKDQTAKPSMFPC